MVDRAIRDEVRSLVDAALEILAQAASLAALYDETDEGKLDNIVESLRHV